MKKIALHWQILFALVLAVLYGMFFPTKYIITDESLERLKLKDVPESIINILEPVKNQSFASSNALIIHIEQLIDKEHLKPYRSVIIKEAYFNKQVKAISWMGDIFLRALKMLILPLILSSIISGVSNIGSAENFGRLGLKTFSYYIVTSLLAILTGLFLVNLIQPGTGADLNFSETVEGLVSQEKSLGQTFIEIVPINIFQSFVENNTLSIIFFSMLFGFFITRIHGKYKILLTDLFNGTFEVMMKITMFVVKFTPFGVFGIVAKVISEQSNILELAQRLGLYMLVVIAGLVIHMFITLPLLTRTLGKVRPYQHFKNMSTPLLTAFSTSSSGATLPLTMQAIEENSGVSNKISSFVLPLGATINMDGTALYECVAAMFIAQAYGVEMSVMNQVIIVVTSLLASIGAAAVPMAGLVIMSVILTAVGLPFEGLGLILAVDRILDMFRTSVNVWSDCCGTAIIAKSEGEKLPIDIIRGKK